jgi:hypothetical protein
LYINRALCDRLVIEESRRFYLLYKLAIYCPLDAGPLGLRGHLRDRAKMWGNATPESVTVYIM